LTGIDTNILIRYVIQDDPLQFSIASNFLDSLTAENPGYITLVSLAELCWVLIQRYKLPRISFVHSVQSLLASEEIEIQSESIVRQALSLFMKSNADFADCLIAGCSRAAGCAAVVTFDKKAAKSIGMTLLY
jgi:predicted nucleic-acid-binding protein